ncbi:MAG: PEP-CTERM sorting domain-containing protein [Bryobacteraceae bacterium]|nr:PEP-CTERM sorting domain-containing protein [Bryobacteraceae bacterium]
MSKKAVILMAVLLAALPGPAAAAAIVFSTSTDVGGVVDSFRAALGDPNNGNAAGPLIDGRREINWDGGGSSATATAGTPFTGFRNIRGATFTTPGTGFVQAPPSGLATLFGNAAYADFSVFSPLRLFSAIGSNVTDTTFNVPGTLIPAYVTGFGAVFSGVSIENTTSIEFFDLAGNSLGGSFAPVSGEAGLSFLGVIFDAGERIGSVRITSGNTAPGPGENIEIDVVFMDDFLYSEPQAVPEPGSLVLVGAALAAAGLFRLRKR